MNNDDFPITTEQVSEGVAITDSGEYEYRTARAPVYGALNGYVRLPDGHPWLDESKFPNGYDIPTEVPWGEITYRKGNWIGFDSMHAGQFWPGESYGPYEGDTHMTDEMVIDWVKQLAVEATEAWES